MTEPTGIEFLFSWIRAGDGPDLRLGGEVKGAFSRTPIAGESVTLHLEPYDWPLKILEVVWEADGSPLLLLEDVREGEYPELTLDRFITYGCAITNPLPRDDGG